MKSIKDEAIM